MLLQRPWQTRPTQHTWSMTLTKCSRSGCVRCLVLRLRARGCPSQCHRARRHSAAPRRKQGQCNGVSIHRSLLRAWTYSAGFGRHATNATLVPIFSHTVTAQKSKRRNNLETPCVNFGLSSYQTKVEKANRSGGKHTLFLFPVRKPHENK